MIGTYREHIRVGRSGVIALPKSAFAIEARRAETPSGSVHESAARACAGNARSVDWLSE